MISATVRQGARDLPRRTRSASFARLVHAEWTKIRSVRSTAWSLGILAAVAIGINALVTAVTIANWRTIGAASRHAFLADPTGFLGATPGIAEIPICVLGVMVISSEYATGTIRASLLAVPRRIPILAAKSAVLAAVTLVIGELIAFASFLIGQAIIHAYIPVSLHDPNVLRAVFGMGLYLTGLGLLGLAIGALVRHTGAALTVMIGIVVVLSNLARTLPGVVGTHIAAYLPTNAGILITHAHQESTDLLAPWPSFAVFCLWVAALMAAAVYEFNRRDA